MEPVASNRLCPQPSYEPPGMGVKRKRSARGREAEEEAEEKSLLFQRYCHLCRRKPRCQELRPRAQQEPSTTCASPTLAQEEPPTSTTLTPEEPPASPEQELSDCATNTSSSVYSCGASSSSVGSGSPEFLGSLFG
ncbi:hypothetical protein KIL84_015947, partial [Mauremys mutica]